MGVADRNRIAVGGHSYGAFMTANLLAHSNSFKAGIAESGAYNRTLTPFGFQTEERTFWEADDTYMKMSPVHLRRQDQDADPAHPRRGGRQHRHLPDSERAPLCGAQGRRRDRPLRHPAQRAAWVPGPGVDAARPLGDERLAGPVGEDRAGERRATPAEAAEVTATASCGAAPAPTSGRTAEAERSPRPSCKIPVPKDPNVDQNAPVWFITGCSTGFGRELARLVLARGWKAVVTARNPESLAELVEDAGDRALALKLDVDFGVRSRPP